jgi:hypothetical protein
MACPRSAKQQYLVVTSYGEPEITVDNIEVAQFVYLLLHNEKIRDVIDTIGKKGVLLLGPPCHPVARIQRHALRHHVQVVTGRSVGLLSGFEESAKGFEFGEAS